MNIEKFTTKAQAALQNAQNLAYQNSHQELDTLHLLLALATEADGLVQPLLQKLGIAVPSRP